MLSLHKALKTKKASLTYRSSTGIGRPFASKLPSSSRFTSALGAGASASGASASASSDSPLGAGMEIASVGNESPRDGEGSAWSDAAIGAGAVGIASFGFGSANEFLDVSFKP